jgi:hypothetical protein
MPIPATKAMTERTTIAMPLKRIAARGTDGDFSQIMKTQAARTMSAVTAIAVFQTMMLIITASIIGRQAIMHAMP